MILRYLLLIFGAVMLVDHSHGKSVTIEAANDSAKENEGIPSTGFIWEAVFRVTVIEKLATLSDEPVKMSMKLFKETYENESITEPVNRFLARVLSENREIAAEEHGRRIEEFLGLHIFFDHIMGTVTDSKEIAIKEALGKRDVKMVATEFQKKYIEFLEWLIPKIDTIKNKFTSERLLYINELKALCQELNDEIDFVKRVGILKKIVERLE